MQTFLFSYETIMNCLFFMQILTFHSFGHKGHISYVYTRNIQLATKKCVIMMALNCINVSSYAVCWQKHELWKYFVSNSDLQVIQLHLVAIWWLPNKEGTYYHAFLSVIIAQDRIWQRKLLFIIFMKKKEKFFKVQWLVTVFGYNRNRMVRCWVWGMWKEAKIGLLCGNSSKKTVKMISLSLNLLKGVES